MIWLPSMQQSTTLPNESLGQGAPVMRRQRQAERCIYGKIAHQLGAAILAGQYKPCDTLLGEIAFSDALNVSRGAYREAMQMLSAKGLVESRPKAGTRVLPRERWNMLDPDVLGWALANESPDPGFLRSLIELCRIVQPAAAALAAQHRDKGDLELLGGALAEMSRCILAREDGSNAYRTFYSAVLSATRSELIVLLSSRIEAAVNLTAFCRRRPRGSRNPVPAHHRVYQAIAVGNPAAARSAMLALVDLTLADAETDRRGRRTAGVATETIAGFSPIPDTASGNAAAPPPGIPLAGAHQ